MQAKVDEVKIRMQENISKALDKVETMDKLASKSDVMEAHSKVFHRNAVSVKRLMRLRSYRITVRYLYAVVILS